MANLDGFVSDARSVTLIMQKEFTSVVGFKEWYSQKQQQMKNNPEFVFFNKLRVDTTHVRPFDVSFRYTTSFPEGLTIQGGKTVDIPLGQVDDTGNLVVDDITPITIDGNPVNNIKRSTTQRYFFTDRPNEDAIKLCDTHLQKLQELTKECHNKFDLS
jgi:hypothetical protein